MGLVKPLFRKLLVSVKLTEFSPKMGVTTSPYVHCDVVSILA